MAWRVILKNGEQHSFDHKPTDEEIDALYAGQGSLPINTEVAGSDGDTGQMEVSGINLRKSGSSVSYKPKKLTTLDLDTKKKIRDELAAYNAGMSFLKNAKESWRKTSPPLRANQGLMPQPLYGIEQYLGAMFQDAFKFGKNFNQTMDKTHVRWINATRSKLAREVIGKDIGNLNEYEQKVAVGGTAGLTDTYETGMELFKKTEQVLKDMRDARIMGYKNLEAKYTAEGRILDEAGARKYLELAGGNKDRARLYAAADGWTWK